MNMLTTLPGLFVQGGLFIMSLITVLFVGLLLAAWKAPAWVKEIGIIINFCPRSKKWRRLRGIPFPAFSI